MTEEICQVYVYLCLLIIINCAASTWVGLGWVGLGWDGWVGMGGLGWVGWVGLGWLGWVGLGLGFGLGWVLNSCRPDLYR